MVVSDAHVFPGFLTPVLHNFLSKATYYFSNILQQRWEVKIHQKESSPPPGIELATTKSWVWHTHHWATRAGFNINENQVQDMKEWEARNNPEN